MYFFDVESGVLVNKLQGHSSAVLCVCWTYDESMLASCDTEVGGGAGSTYTGWSLSVGWPKLLWSPGFPIQLKHTIAMLGNR